MKWYVYYDAAKQQYQLSNDSNIKWVAAFINFDMAYDYVTNKNKMTDVTSYSRWAR